MFETEAGFAETKMLIKCNGDYSKKQDYKKGWQDGAEFGYNKATEELEARKFAMVMSEKVEKQLRKENAELKAEIENDRDLPTVAYMQGAENQKKKDEKQLTKAKDLLERWLKLYNTNTVKGIIADTEKYLKEIEKC